MVPESVNAPGPETTPPETVKLTVAAKVALALTLTVAPSTSNVPVPVGSAAA
jgi:hypothetical protein